MHTFFRMFSILINFTMAVVAIVAIPMVIVNRGPTWEAWLLAAIAVANTVAINLVVATIEGKEEKS